MELQKIEAGGGQGLERSRVWVPGTPRRPLFKKDKKKKIHEIHPVYLQKGKTI